MGRLNLSPGPAMLRPNSLMTAPKMVCLLELYRRSGYRASYLEVHKLAYLLKVAGEPGLQGLIYQRSNYGPYAYNLNHALDGVEGDNSCEQNRDRSFERISQLIEGFETPYGMEMLATLHWVARRPTSFRRLRGGDSTGAGMERSEEESV